MKNRFYSSIFSSNWQEKTNFVDFRKHSVNLTENHNFLQSFLSHGKKSFAKSCNFPSNWRNFSGNLQNWFFPVNLTKKYYCKSDSSLISRENASKARCHLGMKSFATKEKNHLVYLVNYIKILLHDHCLGCKGFASRTMIVQ